MPVTLSSQNRILNMFHSKDSIMWVCWKKPPKFPPENTTFLSFMPPAMEEAFEQEYEGSVIHARELSLQIRGEAKELYLNLVASIGIVPIDSQHTMRQVLAREGEVSQWWYHPVSFKNCGEEPTFDWIIAILTIRAAAEKFEAKKIVLVGAPEEVVEVLKSAYVVEKIDTRNPRQTWWVWIRSLALRTLYGLSLFHHWFAVFRHIPPPKSLYDVVLFGFWDWSVHYDGQTKSIRDRYYKSLPDELEKKNLKTGWFAWFDPQSEPRKEKRALEDVLKPLRNRKDVVILQSFLNPFDIIKNLVDFRALITFLKIRKQKPFREVFRANGIDFWPLFAEPLLAGFVGATIPHCNLLSLATVRASLRYQPKASLTFQEHFLDARAHYEGIRRAVRDIICFTVQHASYSHGKTYLFLHPMLEFKGQMDGCPVPHPDYVCAMGALGQELFWECGYPKDNVLLTGSPRYDHVHQWVSHSSVDLRSHLSNSRGESIHILMVLTLSVDLELEMVEALCAATNEMPDIQLYLRNHPFQNIEQDPGFAPYKDKIVLTQGTLEEDIAEADLILFTYSTVAEEAFILGKPVWQWLTLGYNGSALAETKTIPQFVSVKGLRQALQEFHADRSKFLPTEEGRRGVYEQLFFGQDGNSAVRIATAIREALSSKRF